MEKLQNELVNKINKNEKLLQDILNSKISSEQLMDKDIQKIWDALAKDYEEIDRKDIFALIILAKNHLHNTDLEIMIYIIIETGMSYEDLCNLNISDFSLENTRLSIRLKDSTKNITRKYIFSQYTSIYLAKEIEYQLGWYETSELENEIPLFLNNYRERYNAQQIFTLFNELFNCYFFFVGGLISHTDLIDCHKRYNSKKLELWN